jgi:hypothetical protein
VAVCDQDHGGVAVAVAVARNRGLKTLRMANIVQACKGKAAPISCFMRDENVLLATISSDSSEHITLDLQRKLFGIFG